MSDERQREGRFRALAAVVVALMQESAEPAEGPPARIRPRRVREAWPPASPWRWRRR